ncbi:MAG: tRNA dihydrouridine synthase DusB [Pseudomonadota bacterium]|jgi:tRNA-dihydrouridine synthase B
MRIGDHVISPPLVVAPMAGVTDRPFRALCRRMGAGMAVSEMVASDPRLRESAKTLMRTDHAGEPGPVVAQIAGADPAMLADAARFNVERGAQVIDINMGCPAKKVCNVAAGSALLRDETLVARILEAVVAAVDVPVTLKIRTGWDREHRNAPTIARIAQSAGIRALTVHGRTRADAFEGQAEYSTIARVREAVSIPLIANGDIVAPDQARAVLRETGADALMIGRGAFGRPWIFREIAAALAGEPAPAAPGATEWSAIVLDHLQAMHAFYGEHSGVRIARKHLGWYLHALGEAGASTEATRLREQVNAATRAEEQVAAVAAFCALQSARVGAFRVPAHPAPPRYNNHARGVRASAPAPAGR